MMEFTDIEMKEVARVIAGAMVRGGRFKGWEQKFVTDVFVEAIRRHKERKTMDTINLGDLAKDKITGYEGIVTAYTRWLNGCKRFCLQGTELHDKVPVDAQWVDDGQCVLIKANVYEAALVIHGVNEETLEPVGGPRRDDPGHVGP